MMGNRVAAYNFSILLIAREGIEPPTSHRTNWLQQRGVCRSRILFVWQRSVNEQVKALESPGSLRLGCPVSADADLRADRRVHRRRNHRRLCFHHRGLCDKDAAITEWRTITLRAPSGSVAPSASPLAIACRSKPAAAVFSRADGGTDGYGVRVVFTIIF
jgi:hypothetical protein